MGSNGTAMGALDADANVTTVVSMARQRVQLDASRMEEGIPTTGEHAALQGAAVALLTANSECNIMTFTGRNGARASSVYTGDTARHGRRSRRRSRRR